MLSDWRGSPGRKDDELTAIVAECYGEDDGCL